jgi:hypothetical protein
MKNQPVIDHFLGSPINCPKSFFNYWRLEVVQRASFPHVAHLLHKFFPLSLIIAEEVPANKAFEPMKTGGMITLVSWGL